MNHEDYKELIAFDALDALDGGDEGRRALDAHLAECADCRAELNALRDAAASLAYAARPESPAPELRARILVAVKSYPQDARPAPANGDAPTAAQTSGVSSADEFEKRREARDIRVSRRIMMFGSLAASVAVAALLVTLALTWQRNARLEGELARLSETVNRREQELARTEQELARTRADRELLALPAAHTATLASQTGAAGKAHARLTFDAETGRAMLTAADLPPVPAGKAYQLWFIAEGKPPMPGSVFRPDPRGHAEMHETIPPEGRTPAVVFAVTLEPASGVSAPTGEIYLKSSAS
jgi:anti-sigma-K factor RskA